MNTIHHRRRSPRSTSVHLLWVTGLVTLLLQTLPLSAQTAITGANAQVETPEAAAGVPNPQPPLPPPAFRTNNNPTGEYRVGADDLITVEVFGLDDYNRKSRVLRDGTISLPLLGPVKIAGLTLEEAERRIARLLREKQLVRDPQVTLFVEEYLSRGISVQGAVQRPGVYQMLGTKTLLEIIGEAGGLSGREGERAGRSIFVVRQDAQGRQTRLEIDIGQLMDAGDPAYNIRLLPGDAVVVPFDRTYRVYVSGAVKNPGAVEFLSSEGITLLQAITAAGGPSERAKLGSVYIKRQLADGSEEQTKLNLKRIKNGRERDVPLERNDTVVVGDWFF